MPEIDKANGGDAPFTQGGGAGDEGTNFKWKMLYVTVLIVLVGEIFFFLWLTNLFK